MLSTRKITFKDTPVKEEDDVIFAESSPTPERPKRAPPKTRAPPLASKRARTTKASLKKSNTPEALREQRIANMKIKYGVGPVEEALALVPEEFQVTADQLGAGADKDSIIGVINFGVRRAMIRQLWIPPTQRSLMAMLMVPSTVPNDDMAVYETYTGKSYLHIGQKWRKKVDALAVDVLGALTEFTKDKDLEILLEDHAVFQSKYEIPAEELMPIWKFALPVVENGVVAPIGFGISGVNEIWYSFIRGVTTVYLRRRMAAMWKTGGNITKNSGIQLLQSADLKKFTTEYWQAYPNTPYLPPLPSKMPTSSKDWSGFNINCEKLVTIVEEVAQDNFKILSQGAVANRVIPRIEDADLFDEEEGENLAEEIDLTSLSTEDEGIPQCK